MRLDAGRTQYPLGHFLHGALDGNGEAFGGGGRFKGSELTAQQVRRHEVPAPLRKSRGDEFERSVEVNKTYVREARHEY